MIQVEQQFPLILEGVAGKSLRKIALSREKPNGWEMLVFS